ncbi:EamA/RhaT family transporter [Helicobacter aurati]|uniref:EamA/RhaT family transporter n=2 Tax=Helicobacter aurati TaxID=137778 RepID=A0A3D8J9Q5_9HELI|nr:EamA/RhaT family transporter [Helicobacter aurati]
MIIAMMGWGLVWPLSKFMSEALNPEQASFTRFVLVSASFLPIMLYYKISFKIPKCALLPTCLTGIFCAMYNYLMYVGLQYGSAGSAGVIAEVLPLIIAAFLWSFIRKNRLLKREKWGLLLGVISGAFLINIFDDIHAFFTPFNSIYLLAAVCWAFLMISSRYASEHISAVTLSFYSSCITTCSLSSSFFFYGIDDFLKVDWKFWLATSIAALFCTTFSTTIYYRGLHLLGVTQGGVYALLVPIFALGFSWILLAEIPQWHTIIGGIIAIFAIYLINYFNPKHFTKSSKHSS